MKDINVWKLLTNTSGGSISNYCIKNGVAAMGWSLLGDEEKSIPKVPIGERKNIKTYEIFMDYAVKQEYKKSGTDNIKRLVKDVEENDIIWIRCEGRYYLTRVTKNSAWRFCVEKEAVDLDASNQLTNLMWICAGDESQVPGAIRNALIGGGRSQTFCRIHADGVREFSELIYDQKSIDTYKYNRAIELTLNSFYSLLSPDDCEDLLYSWLYNQSRKNYMCIPSTNKKGTQKYEFVMVDSVTGKHIYCQVKNGEVNLDAEEYKYLTDNNDNEVYLFSSKGTVFNAEKYEKIKEVSPKDLFDFACDEKNKNTIPPHINFWIQFALQ